jgi:hypothetical protein
MEELNKLRVKIRNMYIAEIVMVILFVVTLYVNQKIANDASIKLITAIGILISSLSISLIAFKIISLKDDYRENFKNEFVLKALQDTFTNLYYNPDNGIPYSVIAGTQMIYMGNRYYSEDYIGARYKDIKFEQSDVHIVEEHQTTNSKGNTTTTRIDIFKGRWMIFDFNKEFKANVQILQKGFVNLTVKRFFVNNKEKFKKVSMESESFNKKFNVFAQDEHDAFYIITPFIMERIEKLEKQNKGKLLFCFIGNKLHIGISDGKDSFEPENVFKRIDEEKILKEIKGITQFVDELNLENDLFKK